MCGRYALFGNPHQIFDRFPVLFLLVSIGSLLFAPTAEAKDLRPIVRDDFNGYANGAVVGQGNWTNYVNGHNFIVQNALAFRGRKALHNNSLGDSVVAKSGRMLPDGRQTVYIRTENRSGWGTYPDGNAQVRISKGPWAAGTGIFAAVSFKSNGQAAYYDSINDLYQNFATYNDNDWTRLTIEWRSSDKKARYRINNGTWTDWKTFAGSVSFTNFDNVGFDFILPSGSGGVYFDTLR